MGKHGSGEARGAVARLRGRQVPRARRWPWALLAAVLGAAAGSAAAVVVRSLEGTDAPDAQEPDQVQAVVDRLGAPSA
jgi:hypothetical protein